MQRGRKVRGVEDGQPALGKEEDTRFAARQPVAVRVRLQKFFGVACDRRHVRIGQQRNVLEDGHLRAVDRRIADAVGGSG
ncbi:hypothetical protein HRbin27_01279 [bacterium HR27]|nr:hypothetical protein HRbin27_01279 [bacterium HR27]